MIKTKQVEKAKGFKTPKVKEKAPVNHRVPSKVTKKNDKSDISKD